MCKKIDPKLVKSAFKKIETPAWDREVKHLFCGCPEKGWINCQYHD